MAFFNHILKVKIRHFSFFSQNRNGKFKFNSLDFFLYNFIPFYTRAFTFTTISIKFQIPI